MKITSLSIPEVKIIHPKAYEDDRGVFSEIYRTDLFEKSGIDATFVQMNRSVSKNTHTVRGLHYQSPPHAQAKLVRVVRGSIRDVAVDIRSSSRTYGQYVYADLDDKSGEMIFIPQGFLHGFITLEPNTEVIYNVDDYYAPECDGSVRWDSIDIDWGCTPSKVHISEKDERAVAFSDFTSPFKS
jgi:dTDP-4-dehydrorhamnose 3,5-epimerase